MIDKSITRVILLPVKTAISISDRLFQAADKLAERLGMSRSQLYAEAVADYVESHKNRNVTEKLNQLYGGHTSELEEGLRRLQSASISRDDWE